jgi:hypothetical protein
MYLLSPLLIMVAKKLKAFWNIIINDGVDVQLLLQSIGFVLNFMRNKFFL